MGEVCAFEIMYLGNPPVPVKCTIVPQDAIAFPGALHYQGIPGTSPPYTPVMPSSHRIEAGVPLPINPLVKLAEERNFMGD